MYSDRELLELAAKAAGVEIEWRRSAGAYYYDDHETGREEWSPLDDDGQALRLAVKLHMQVSITTESCRAETLPVLGVRVNDKDEMAATRRAIVRAAAAIGEAVQ